MQEEVTQKTIALSMKTGKLTAQALQAALKKYLQHRAKGPKLHHGKQSLKQLKAHGAALPNIEVTEANIGAFKPCAKKYGVDFTLRKAKTTQPPHYIVIFKAKDTDNLEQAFREFTAKTLTKEQRPSIRKVLELAQKFAEGCPKVMLAVMHGGAPEEAQALAEEVRRRIPQGVIEVRGQISPALGVHTGPGLVGICELKME